jgi:hypothetical protein
MNTSKITTATNSAVRNRRVRLGGDILSPSRKVSLTATLPEIDMPSTHQHQDSIISELGSTS